MSESSGIDSISGGSMPKPYSNDLRARVIEAIETGASRREAAERYEISASAALTPDEVVLAMRKRRIACSRSAVWRFFDRSQDQL